MLSEQAIVVRMRSDPEPDDFFIFLHAQGPVAQTDPGGVDRTRGMDLLELETRMARIALELPIGSSRLVLDAGRQVREGLAEALGRS